MTQLSPNFSLEELTFSETAVRKGVDNTPPPQIVARLTDVARRLEEVRAILGVPLRISSGYRCSALNKLIGGSKTSAHMEGYAVDFQCSIKPIDVCKKLITAGIHFDQLIQEGTWTHISFDPKMRGMTMTAHFTDGVASYTNGV